MPIKKLISILVVAQLLNVSVAHAGEDEAAPAPEIVPDSISDIYSDVDMRVRLAAKPNAAPCVAENCSFNQEFDARVQQLGAQLSTTAYTLYPTLKKRVPQFSFSVIDKKNPGTASNGAGKILVLRGLQQMELTDDALGFILAREMGHVIGKHHVKNTSTKLIISALAAVLFPAAGIIGASSAATQATTATTLLTSAASTATSMLGSEVAMAKMKPSQLAESDEIALNLMNHQDWEMYSVACILQFDETSQNGWTEDLQTSDNQLQKMVEEETLAILPLEDADLVFAEDSTDKAAADSMAEEEGVPAEVNKHAANVESAQIAPTQ